MLTLRKSAERGQADHGWLKTNYTFSFSDYHDPKFMGFRCLRVINQDIVAPHTGFGTHPHRDMEIITVILSGAVSHRDSMNNQYSIGAGEVQCMTAGTGIQHSEQNALDENLELLQIWIIPEKMNLKPSYGQKKFGDKELQNQLCELVNGSGQNGALKINQNCKMYRSLLSAGKKIELKIEKSRGAWLQLIKGSVEFNGQKVAQGDGVAVVDETNLEIKANSDSDFLLFDLP